MDAKRDAEGSNNMIRLVQMQFALSTAEEERYYFTGNEPATYQIDPASVLPSGTYRIVDGHFYRIVGEAAPISAT